MCCEGSKLDKLFGNLNLTVKVIKMMHFDYLLVVLNVFCLFEENRVNE